MFFISYLKLFSLLRYLNFWPELLVKWENSLIRNLRLISKLMTSPRMLFRIPAIKNLEISNENIGGGGFQVFRNFFPTNIYTIKL